MSELITYRLDEIADVIDCEHKTAPKVDSSEYYSIRTPDIKNGRLLYEQANRVSAETYELWTKRGIPEAGDIILAREAPVGEVGWIDKDHKICLGQRTVLIKIRSSQIEKKYLLYSFVSPKFKDYLNELSGGSVVAHLNMKDIRALEFSFPPLPEQKAIASVLSSLDDKIDLLHRQNKTLEAMAETLFRQWSIEEAKEDWEECELSEFGHIICGKTPSKSNANYFGNDVPFLKIPDMHGRVFISKTTDNLSQLGALSQSKKMVPQNSICVSCIATVGLVCITDCDLQTNQQINSIVPNELKFLYYLYEVMLDMYDELHNLASGGTATLNLNTGDFSRIKIVKPDDVTLLQFNNAVIPLFTKIRFNGSQIQTLEQLRDMLLPKLMSGEVRVQYQTEEVA